MASLNFSLFCFVLFFCYAFVQYCKYNSIHYAMHKFVGVLDNPHKGENFFRVIKVAAHTYG